MELKTIKQIDNEIKILEEKYKKLVDDYTKIPINELTWKNKETTQRKKDDYNWKRENLLDQRYVLNILIQLGYKDED